MSARARLLNPTGLTLLALSCLLAVAIATLPPLAAWSSRAALIAVIGLIAYVLTVLAQGLPDAPPPVNDPMMRRLLEIRRSMASRLAELEEADARNRSPLIPIVADAVRHMDSQLVPTFRSIVIRHQDLDRHLALFESGKLVSPDPQNLERLHRIHERQQEAIDGCVRQAANAYATLIALLQEADEAGVAKQAMMWAADLSDMYDGLAEVYSGIDPYERALMEMRLDADKSQLARPLIKEALERVEPSPAPPPVAGRVLPAAGKDYPNGLTQREAEVLSLLADGLSSKQIADRLVITIATVSRHIANIYNKIDARGRADATRYALQNSVTSNELFRVGETRRPANGH